LIAFTCAPFEKLPNGDALIEEQGCYDAKILRQAYHKELFHSKSIPIEI
jgi:hypothetical protein